MNLKNVCAIGAISGTIIGVALGASIEHYNSKKEINNLQTKNTELYESKTKLLSDIQQKDTKIKQLEKDIFNREKNHVADVYAEQLDSLKKLSPEKLSQPFYERIINNASFLDSLDNRDLRMRNEVTPKIPFNVIENIHQSSLYSSKASKNLTKFFSKII